MAPSPNPRTPRRPSTSAVAGLALLAAWLGALTLGAHGVASILAVRGVAGASLLDDAAGVLLLAVGGSPAPPGAQPPLELQIAGWLLPFLTASLVLFLAWLAIRNEVQLRWTTLKGDHTIIAGDADLTEGGATAVRRSDRRVVLWVDKASAPWVRDAADRGAPHVSQRRSNAGVSRLGLARARNMLITGESVAANLRLAGAAMAEANRVRVSGDPFEIVVRVNDNERHDCVSGELVTPGRHAPARVRLVSVPNVVAREFLLGQPLDRFVRRGGVAQPVFFLNFSPICEAIALRIMVGAHFGEGAAPALVALDPEAERRRDALLARRPGVGGLRQLWFETAPVEQAARVETALAEAIQRHGPPVLIVVDPADAARASAIGLAASAYFRERDLPCPPVHARAAGGSEARASCSLFTFGDRASSAELLLQEQQDALARAVHEFYLDGQLQRGVQIGATSSMHEWSDLAEAVREENRLVADCFVLKLRDIGARLARGNADGLTFEGDELEQLARAEHERWMADLRADGWVYGEMRDDKAKRHPAIVAYDRLPESVKQLDLEQIRIMARLIKRTGHYAVRDIVAAVDVGDERPGGIAEGMRAGVEELRRRYPDRAVVVRGVFDIAAVREALIAGADAGAIVQLVLPGNADRTLATLSGAERRRAWSLYRGADRWFSVPEGARSAEEIRAFVLGGAEVRLASVKAAPSDLPTLALNAPGVDAR